MPKAVLVMDMPDKCVYCPLSRLFGMGGAAECRSAERVNRNCESVPDWCPLRELPEKATEMTDADDLGVDYVRGTMDGWNACLDAIINGATK